MALWLLMEGIRDSQGSLDRTEGSAMDLVLLTSGTLTTVVLVLVLRHIWSLKATKDGG